jgi:hypothetical protein
MLKALRELVTRGFEVLAIVLMCAVAALAAVPQGWYMEGSRPTEYEAGVDAQVSHGAHPSAYLKARKTGIDGFGTLMQDFRAKEYAGKRVRFSAFVKSQDVESWAGLWMRVDKREGATPQVLAFDNMSTRPIKGTADWTNYAVVLDVSDDATGIFFGMMINGSGNVWMSDVKVETVGMDVPTTALAMGSSASRPDGPTNLNFEQ